MNRSKKLLLVSCLGATLFAGMVATASADDDDWGRIGLNLFLGGPAYPQPYYAPPPVYYAPPPPPAYGYYAAPGPAYYAPRWGGDGDGWRGRGRWRGGWRGGDDD
ncbi:MAG TPA: hypothetical protein VFN66_02060 [Burkholderiales bacterium]|nr:hypothetical protein [Burkholderiales bacterium]